MIRGRNVIIILLICLAVALAAVSIMPNLGRFTSTQAQRDRVSQASVTDTTSASLPYRFVVMADSRGSNNGVNDAVLKRVMKQVKMLSPQPKAIFFVGDMVGGGPLVSQQLQHWKDIMDNYYPLSMIYPAIGNHEGFESAFSKAFAYLPDNDVKGFGRTAYRVSRGNIEFIVLNSEENHSIDGAQRTWLTKQLQDNKARLKFVFFHEPAFPTGSHVGSSLDANQLERDRLWQVLDANGANMVFVGHEHNYTRRHVDASMNETVKGQNFIYHRKIYQVTAGSVGAPLTKSYKSRKNVDIAPKAAYNFAVVDVTSKGFYIRVLDDHGKLIDKF
ncbi:MAG TPA: metallophosphoesterase [Candidatus Aquicultor sp.]